ncbi:unnamed protein product [Rotaria magnacalcarata]|nr:unnamed protein product [Rotaria magnacalcarata]CAF4187587.1 unnamed protein product [Rotaria magnacalcarata]CAF4380154.1 unnamed protein product [Rotaria magnacalcarata]CAF4391056.1 unnamed protein product [Rotaria magnacalcarata]
MATEGRARLAITLALAQKVSDTIRKTEGLWCYGDELIGATGIFAIDPSKLIIRVNDIDLSGFKASKILRKYTTDLLTDALHHLSKHHRQTDYTDFMLVKLPNGLPRSVINVRDAYFTTKTRRVSLDEGVGHVLVQSIIPYPPGIPRLVPGEIMEQHYLDFLRYFLDKGG